MKNKKEAINDLKTIIRTQEEHVKEIAKRLDVGRDYVLTVIKFIFEENVDFYNSIIILYEAGQFQSCLLLGRSIIENSINLRYILKKDSERRAKNYIFHTTAYILKQLNNFKDYKNEEIPLRDEMIQQYEEFQNRINKSGSKNFHWDGKSFKEICDEVGSEKIYNNWYSRLSIYVHSQYKDNGDLDEKGPYNDYLRRLIFQDMPVLTLQTLKDINNKYSLLEGGAIIKDYPKKGASTLFSISNDETDKQVSDYHKNKN